MGGGDARPVLLTRPNPDPDPDPDPDQGGASPGLLTDLLTEQDSCTEITEMAQPWP